MVTAALKIRHLTDLNTYLINRDGSVIFTDETISIPSFMPGAENADVLDFLEKSNEQKDQLYTFASEWGLNYLGYRFSGDDYMIISGPFMELTPNTLMLAKYYQLDSTKSETLNNFCNQIQILTTDMVNSYASIIQLFKHLMDHKVSPIKIKKQHIKNPNEKSYHYFRVDEDVNELVELRYKIEAAILHAVKHGNKDKALHLLDSDNMLFNFSERFPNEPLRRIKNLAIVLNTLLRTAAREQKVPPILIHRISEKFAIDIENKINLAELKKINNDIVTAYADLIRLNSLANFSKLTQDVITYLTTFYDKKIETKSLADIFFVHPSHLSRTFKQETNLTITSYLQDIRVNQATFLLTNEQLSIEEVAWKVGYEDPSYFTRIFKSNTGYTPSQYRDK